MTRSKGAEPATYTFPLASAANADPESYPLATEKCVPGAIVEFGYLDADEDKYRYMGRAFSFLGWDELTSWPGDGLDSLG